MPTNGFSIEILKVKLFAGLQTATKKWTIKQVAVWTNPRREWDHLNMSGSLLIVHII